MVLYKVEPFSFDEDDNISEVLIGDELVTRGHRITGKWTFFNVVPAAIEQTTLAIEASDSLLDFNISFAFESFKFVNMVPLYDDLGRFNDLLDISIPLNSYTSIFN